MAVQLPRDTLTPVRSMVFESGEATPMNERFHRQGRINSILILSVACSALLMFLQIDGKPWRAQADDTLPRATEKLSPLPGNAGNAAIFFGVNELSQVLWHSVYSLWN